MHPELSIFTSGSTHKIRVGVLGSGKGSNLVALAEAARLPKCPYEIVVVGSDVENAGILHRAADFGITPVYLPPGRYRTKLEPEAEQHAARVLREAGVEVVALAGFMRILKNDFLGAFAGRVINIHPSLLPAFPGLQAWKQALDYGAKVAGCTVHFVDQGIDTGAIIMQMAVPIEDTDTETTLHARIQDAERIIYPEALRLLTLGQIEMQGRLCRHAVAKG